MNSAFSSCDDSVFRFYIPRTLGTTKLSVFIFNESMEESLLLDAEWIDIDSDSDVFELNAKLSIGLCFFYLELITCYGKIYGFRENANHIYFTKENSGCKFQLTVSDFKHSKPDEFYGGIIYQIFVDRFAKHGEPIKKEGAFLASYEHGIPEYPEYPGAELKNNTFYGGNLYGVIDKLDYICSLGANIIYLCPIFESPSNHKYDTADYMNVDKMFGGEEALKSLISEAHERKMKIILDGVFNHTGDDSVYFNKYGTYDTLGAYQSKDSKFYDWYEFKDYPNTYTCWWNISILPRINTQKQSCSDFFVGEGGVVEKYSKLGVDGFRLDVADELSDVFIEKIKSRLEYSRPGSILYGEVWEDASNKIAYSTRKRYYLGSELDGVMNYPLRRGIIDFILHQKTESLEYALTEVLENAPRRIRDVQMNLLGTHDTKRIITVLGGDEAQGLSNSDLVSKRMNKTTYILAKHRLLMAYAILATLPGIPSVFYGDEVGIEGYGDPFNRMPYPWGDEDKEILDFYRKIGIIRRGNMVYCDGDFELLHLTPELLLFSRKKDGKIMLTAVNNSDSCIKVSFSRIALGTLSEKKDFKFTIKKFCAEIFELNNYGTELTLENIKEE